MKTPEKFLIFHGPSGTSKTHFCAALTEWIFCNFDSFRKWREADLLSRLREGIGDRESDYAKNLEFMVDDDLVILDDVGSWYTPGMPYNKDYQWKTEVFLHFIDTRYNDEKPTIVTSNFTKDEFSQIYGPRVWDRLFATENKFMISDGESQRQLGK